MASSSIILYGGAFDPIHNGHLRLASAASALLDADVFMVPNKTPPWKKEKARLSARLALLRLAIKEYDNPRIKICLFEAKSDQEISYSIDTVKYFKKRYPNKKIYLLVGADAYNEFDQWKQPVEIANLATIVVIPRPGCPISIAMQERFPNTLILDYQGSGDISSSSVRALQGYDIPESVRDYIEDHRLYYFAKLRQYLTPKRLRHCIEVGRLAYDIARSNHIENPGRYYAAGLLHDIAKILPEQEALELMQKHYPEYLEMPNWTYHQFLGAYLAKNEFGILDQEILEAIGCHCTGKARMSLLDKALYASDKIEPTRGYDSSGYISACKDDIESGFIVVLRANEEFYASKGWTFISNEMTRQCVMHYLGERHD